MPHTKEMRTLPIPTGRLLIVPGETLPEDAAGITVKNGEVFWLSDMRGYGEESLPPGYWSLLGKASELTEEQAEILVEESARQGSHVLFVDYVNDGDFLRTASESLKSFLTFHDIKPEDVLLIENKK